MSPEDMRQLASCDRCQILTVIVRILIERSDLNPAQKKVMLEKAIALGEYPLSERQRSVCPGCKAKGSLHNPCPGDILKVLPPKYHVACDKCGFRGTGPTNYGGK